jgi:hypothetical protein
VVTDRTRRRARQRIERLADSAIDSDELRREAIAILGTAIGFDRWCTLLLDPDTLVIAQGIGEIDWHAELPQASSARPRAGTWHAQAAGARHSDRMAWATSSAVWLRTIAASGVPHRAGRPEGAA